MAKTFETSISSGYAHDWKFYEATRDSVVNAQDGVDQYGGEMKIAHRAATNTLVITNTGSVLSRKHLLMGVSSKRDDAKLRGQFGEGLKLSCLAYVRAGHAVKIRTGGETWTPVLVHSKVYDEEVLAFRVAGGNTHKERVQIEVSNVTAEDWEEIRDDFLFVGARPKKTVETNHGTLLRGEKYAGRIYVRGVFVMADSKLHYGYDLAQGALNRDRKMIDRWDLENRLHHIWREAVAADPELVESYGELLEEAAADVGGVNEYNATLICQEATEAIEARFLERYGDDAIPVKTTGEGSDLDHLGKKGVVVTNDGLRTVLQKKFGTPWEVAQKLADAVEKTHGWSDLEDSEKLSLDRALGILGKEVPWLDRGRLDVVDFRDEKLRGTHSFEGGEERVRLSRAITGDPGLTLRVLIHEVAHHAGGDGSKSHVSEIERLWSAVAERALGN